MKGAHVALVAVLAHPAGGLRGERQARRPWLPCRPPPQPTASTPPRRAALHSADQGASLPPPQPVSPERAQHRDHSGATARSRCRPTPQPPAPTRQHTSPGGSVSAAPAPKPADPAPPAADRRRRPPRQTMQELRLGRRSEQISANRPTDTGRAAIAALSKARSCAPHDQSTVGDRDPAVPETIGRGREARRYAPGGCSWRNAPRFSPRS